MQWYAEFKEVFNSVKMRRPMREFKLPGGMFDPLSQFVRTVICMITIIDMIVFPNCIVS